MKNPDFILNPLSQPLPASPYFVSQTLKKAFPERALLEGDACPFDLTHPSLIVPLDLTANTTLNCRLPRNDTTISLCGTVSYSRNYA